MLIVCPECDLQVSDRAIVCPHCGYPMQPDKVVRASKSTKRKRLPNGFGQITKLKNKNLRKPFRAMVTIGRTSTGKIIQKLLKPECYFETYNEAYAALIEYNKHPYDLNDSITVKELYERWSKIYFESLKSKSGYRSITSAWRYCASVYDMRVTDLRARHIKYCMDEGIAVINDEERTASPSTQCRIKSVFNLMLDYAVEYELVDRNYARTFNISSEVIDEAEDAKRSHISFTDAEMETLWNNINVPYVRVVLFQCYSGWRPQELGLIRLENVDLESGWITGGMKTDAGIDRPVPIHAKIREIVESMYQEAVELGSEYLINCMDGTTHRSSIKFTYDKYRHRFDKIVGLLKLNPEHRPHDGRKQFVTMAKKYKVDEYAIKYMAGHKITDITESVYTERDKEWLVSEIAKIK